MWLYSCESKPINIKSDYPTIEDQISNLNISFGDTIHLVFLQCNQRKRRRILYKEN